MKRILVTGENSYIGTSFVSYMEQFKGEYEVDTISVRGNRWIEEDFSKYDIVLHLASIVHVKEEKDIYYKVNTLLTEELAEKSKFEGVNQFIFLSTMSVYGVHESIINKNSKVSPSTDYGKSKLKAEKSLLSMETKQFKVSIIRPPMVYGKNSVGNFKRLLLLSRMFPIFIDSSNSRSMIYIDNLLQYIKIIIDRDLFGIFHPQNKELINTFDMFSLMRKRKTYKIEYEGLKFSRVSILNKIFGDLFYDRELDVIPFEDYCFTSFKESIELSTKENINKNV